MTPPPRELTESQRELKAIVEEVVGRRDVTPPLVVTEARVYEIAEEVAKREQPSHMRFCETDESGPVCRIANELGGRINTMEAKVTAIQVERAEERGANREIARDAARATTLRAAVISAALSLAVGLGLFALNRWFPAHAHAAQTTIKAP